MLEMPACQPAGEVSGKYAQRERETERETERDGVKEEMGALPPQQTTRSGGSKQ
jgi:hypothetical protein